MKPSRMNLGRLFTFAKENVLKMGTTWRWDQGRLEYFMFENLREIAKSLVGLNGMEINPQGFDPLRPVLEHDTGLSFSPKDYRVWRNYGRVFGCALLATKADNRLFVSEICIRLAGGIIRDVDEYLALLVERFRFPSPVFDSYDSVGSVIYPFAALLKLLSANSRKDDFPGLSVPDVFAYLIGNECTGLEPINFYQSLRKTNHEPTGDQDRQVREMMTVLSQFSFLKWSNKKLYLDTSFDLETFLGGLEFSITSPNPNREVEFAKLTGNPVLPRFPTAGQVFESPIDLLFTEGKRTRISHLKIERSPLLRKLFFEKFRLIVCQMCDLEPRKKYPWTDNLLEIHHLLPLSSGVTVTAAGTSLDDIVPLCPTCHRGTHVYYKWWLNGNQTNDFASKAEAKAVFMEAKKKIML